MSHANPPDFDSAAFRQALGQFATGVTVITTRAPSGQLIGITASSFNSVSLDPPLVLWSLAHKSASTPVFRGNSHYVVNVLAASQLDLCKRFSTYKGDRFEGIAHAAGNSGMPVLDVDTSPWIAAIGIVAIVAAIVGIAAAVVTLHGATADPEIDPRGRIAFMGDVGIVVSVIFLAVIVFSAVAVPSLDACNPG